MRRARFPFFPLAWLALLLLGVVASPVSGQSTSSPLPATPAHKKPIPKPAAAPAPSTAAEMAASLTRLTQANQDLLDLLKKQQAVLEDIQYDRRLQNRQISSLEARLQESLEENAKLQAKVAKLEEQVSMGPAPATPSPAKSGITTSAPAPTPASPAKVAAAPPPPPPATYLPPAPKPGLPGTKSWQRLFTLSGNDNRDSQYFHIEGRQWRVIWHNQDQPGAAYANTSALFISAFPKGDPIPQKVCSKLGSGGDTTELTGPADFYLKIEASGGKWEFAVEDFK